MLCNDMKLKEIKKERDEKMAREALAFYKQGLTLREIAEIQGISHEWVRQLIEKLPEEKKED